MLRVERLLNISVYRISGHILQNLHKMEKYMCNIPNAHQSGNISHLCSKQMLLLLFQWEISAAIEVH